MTNQVRVRFAPSPTGPLHIGGVRTALFNYLFAKQNNGVFYIRIEDTDQNRYVEGAEEYIFEALKWLGISPDETIGKNEKFGPYRQSERKELYKQYADQLIEAGWAYYAFDSSEELDELRKNAETAGQTFIYNHSIREQLNTSLKLSKEEVDSLLNSDTPYVIRFKTPVNEVLVLNDMIRGEVKFDTNLLDDKVLYKSDGMPTYHLANIVDDHLMETSHVIRGEEWLPSLPLHELLYKAFGWEAPKFAHLPLILKPVGNGKLSKRDGDKLGFPVFPLDWQDPITNEKSSGYREKGYYPEAVINFLALLGWNDGTEQELFSLEELVERFDLNRVHKAGAKFDPEKNKWFNQHYLKLQSDADLTVDFQKILVEKGIKATDEYVEKVVSSIKERATFVSDFYDLSDFFFVAPTEYDAKALKNWKEDTGDILMEVAKELQSIEVFEARLIETRIKDWISAKEIGMGKVMQPLRLSLVGALKGPDLFDIIEMLGVQETVSRIETAVKNI
ncbi:glutamate--tRNA ligase [Myroides guanonis]|uniref:Glutamate--tRNA ligase n=1 Tax=Myroides guanonis TaxID=1150112 RepID=A0A1I3RM55_9FLAO|nr:glutamate--tRNA ligase [Myroides guanonis]SFJ47328.1 glutamyl-tRNA synthetase [Myroides guanonis]